MIKRSDFYYFCKLAFCFTVIVVLSMELILKLPRPILIVLNNVDIIIGILLLLDYVIEFFYTQNNLNFIKMNIIGFLAVIPTDIIVLLFCIPSLSEYIVTYKIIKFVKLIRIMILLELCRDMLNRLMKITLFMYSIIGTFITTYIGAIGIEIAEGISFEDSLWWSFVTATTVGYGDITPTTILGKCIASILIVSGTVFISILTGTIVAKVMKKTNKDQDYKKKVISEIKEKLDDFDELSEEEIKQIYNVLKGLKK